jgi:hypothetical protein
MIPYRKVLGESLHTIMEGVPFIYTAMCRNSTSGDTN